MYAEWIRDGLRKSGKKQTELAKELKLHESAVAKIVGGNRGIKLEELPIIAKFIGQPMPGNTGGAAHVIELEEENAWLKLQLADCLLKLAMLKRKTG